MQIEIRHIGSAADGEQFTLRWESMTYPAVTVRSPEATPVAGYDKYNLKTGLVWYMEELLRHPFAPEKKLAGEVVSALESWGWQTFDALFSGDGRECFYAAKKDLKNLQIRLVSDSPSVLSWPWEAMRDRREGYIFLQSSIERQPTEIDVVSHAPVGKADSLSILFVISRPHDEDIDYHLLSRDVAELISGGDRPVNIDVLRPPTFDNLRRTLESRHYDIVHFDGHGGYGENPTSTRDSFKGAEGLLCFEKYEDGRTVPDLVGAETIGQLLSGCGVPVMVLNACQSAMVDERAEDVYASVAARLLKAHVRSVVAMGYSLFTGGAKAFVPAFYSNLLDSGDPARAVREGRDAMYQHTQQDDSYPLNDWLVPQLYQQTRPAERVLPDIRGLTRPRRKTALPKDAVIDGEDFIGRGQVIMELERKMLETRPAILIHGIAGQGKTTVAQGFLRWLEQTGGLDGGGCPVVWIDFRDIHSAEAVIDAMAEGFLDEDGRRAHGDEKRELLIDAMHSRKKIVVWDNFESASGLTDNGAPNLTPEDMAALIDLLREMKRDKTVSRIIITSRTEETQLDGRLCGRLSPLSGLEGGELWSFCVKVAQERELKPDRGDRYLRELLDRLDGNPLSVRSVLLRLSEVGNAKRLLEDFDRAFAGAEGDESTKRIRATFKMLCQGTGPELAPVFQTLSLFECYADLTWVVNIVGHVRNYPSGSAEVKKLILDTMRCFARIVDAGFARQENGTVFKLHPALRGCLAEAFPPEDELRRMFVEFVTAMEKKAHDIEQDRRAFAFYNEANCRRARSIAGEYGMRDEYLSLTFALSSFADDRDSFAECETLLLELGDKARLWGDAWYENKAYSLLSNHYEAMGNKALSLEYARKAADMAAGRDELSANDYVDLGKAADMAGDTVGAIAAWEKAAEIWEREGDIRAVMVYGALFNIAQGEKLEKYKKKLEEHVESVEDRSLKATIYGSLGNYERDHGNPDGAFENYMKALALYKDLGNGHMTAAKCNDIGLLLIQTGNPAAAETFLDEAYHIAVNLKDEPVKARTCNNLAFAFAMEGKPRRYAADKAREALEIYKKLGDSEKAAATQELIDAIEAGKFDR